MLGQTAKKYFFIYLAVKKYHKLRKMARNFGPFYEIVISLDCQVNNFFFVFDQA